MARRRLIEEPLFRAAFLTTLIAIGAAILSRATLTRANVDLSKPLFFRAIVAPLAIVAIFGSLAFVLAITRNALLLRAGMRKIASGDLTKLRDGEDMQSDRDLLGIRDAFDAMRAELDRALRRLGESDAQRRRLFADLAHELATPASSLLGLGDTLARADLALDEEKRARLMKALENETLRIARLVEDIRDLAELDDPDVSFVIDRQDISETARAAVDRMEHIEGAAIVFEAEKAYAEVDAIRLEQAIVNLLTNARRYTPHERRIRVEVRSRLGVAEIVVEDEGPGVPAELLERLGERLFRVDEGRDRERGGHGLGLSIVRAVAARHNGQVRFEAGKTGGLRATLFIPSS